MKEMETCTYWEHKGKSYILKQSLPDESCRQCVFNMKASCNEAPCNDIRYGYFVEKTVQTVETDLSSTFTAPGMLTRASELMVERAKQYDSPGGERSMEKIITAFNAISGKNLTESEGWLLMAILKMVRDRVRQKGHQDSCEDLISYAALYGECRMNEKE